MAEKFANNAKSTLSGSINGAVTSLVVANAATFPASGNFRIRIGTEILLVTGVAGTTFTVARGQEATSVAAHTSGDEVTHVLTAASLALAVQENGTILATSLSATGNARAKIYSDLISLQTTDATVTSAFTWTILDEAVTTVTVECSAIKSDGSKTASYVRRVRVKRDGGTVTVGTVNDVFTDEESSFDCDVTVDNSTSTGRVRVTGIAATTIDWAVVVTRLEHSHA